MATYRLGATIESPGALEACMVGFEDSAGRQVGAHLIAHVGKKRAYLVHAVEAHCD